MSENPTINVAENLNAFVENIENPIKELVDDFFENTENVTKNPCDDDVSVNIFDPRVWDGLDTFASTNARRHRFK